MPAGRAGKTRNLAPDGDRIETRGQGVSNRAHERTNRPHTPRRWGFGIQKWLRHRALQTQSVHKPRNFWACSLKVPMAHGLNAKRLISMRFALPVFSSNCREPRPQRAGGRWDTGSSQSYPQNLCIGPDRSEEHTSEL